MANTYVMSKKTAITVLRSILDERKEVREKSAMQLEALNIGARALELAVVNGALLHHEASIIRYHANYKGAYMFTDERTRGALKAAIARLEREIAHEEDDRERGGADE